MEVLLATLKESWSNEAESGCDVERLVDDDGYLTFVADTSFPNEQHYEEIYDEEKPLIGYTTLKYARLHHFPLILLQQTHCSDASRS